MEHTGTCHPLQPLRPLADRWYGPPHAPIGGRGRRIAGCARAALLVEDVDVLGIRATRWGGYLAAVLLAALLALALPPSPERASRFRSSDPYTPSHAALVAAEGAHRPVEGRLSGGFAFAPWDEGILAGPDEPSADDLATEAAIEAASVGHPDASSRAAHAVLEIRRGRPDAAISLLAAAVEDRPDDPRLLSDLAAAYLERSRRQLNPRSLISALAAADRALALDGGFSEAGFNRALTLERLHLTHGAAVAWERVVEIDPSSGWAGEARQRLARLRAIPAAEERWQAAREELSAAARAGDRGTVRRLVEVHRQPTRQWIDDELLGAWSEAAESREGAEAATVLATARLLAATLRAVTGDHLTADSIGAIDRARGAARARLIDGHRHYRQARRFHEELRYEEAAQWYSRAAVDLEAGDSPFASWARLYQATLLYHRPDLPTALSLLVEQRRTLDVERYSVLGGYVHWVLALVRGRFGPLAAALEDCEASRELFERAGEAENLAHMESMSARVYGEQGDLDRAWRHHAAAFAARPRLRNPRHVENLLFGAVATLRGAGELGPAVAFADEMVAEATLAGHPLGIAVSRRQRGELLVDLGRIDEALASFEDAWRSSDEVPDEGLRQVVRGEILIARGRARCSLDPPAGLSDLEEADSFVTGTQHRHRRIEILRDRARCHIERGDRASAAADLDEGLAEVNRQRGLLGDPALRRAYLDESRALLEEWVHLRLEMGEGAAALGTVERLRSPLLLETMGAARSSEPSVPIEALPERTTLLEFLVLPQELVVWVVDAGGVEVVRIPFTREDLSRRIDAFVASLIQGEEPRGQALGQTLLAGLLPHLERTSTLIVVPDGPLHALPFGALRPQTGGRYLIERFAIATVPSARAYAALAERGREARAGRATSVLAVGGVPFEPRLFAGLPALPRSEQEARRVAALYPRSTQLLGAAATAKRFLEESPRHDVIHLATHALIFSGEPDLASLVLAPAQNGATDGLLSAGEIRFEEPVTTRLVVLASCRSLQGTISATEGPLSLARPFLAAGIPAVIGSLWDLDELTSLSFFSRFHAAHAAGSDALTAFHEAQLALLNDGDPRLSSPRSWAGLVYLGANAGPLPPQSSLDSPGSEPRKESSP